MQDFLDIQYYIYILLKLTLHLVSLVRGWRWYRSKPASTERGMSRTTSKEEERKKKGSREEEGNQLPRQNTKPKLNWSWWRRPRKQLRSRKLRKRIRSRRPIEYRAGHVSGHDHSWQQSYGYGHGGNGSRYGHRGQGNQAIILDYILFVNNQAKGE